jgi:hypothetical protein
MEFQLSAEDAEILRHLAGLEPLEARRYLQDHPPIARRMTHWPPEIRIEICRMIYRSFSDTQREALESRRQTWSDLLELLRGED